MLELRDPEASVGHSFLVLSLLSLYTKADWTYALRPFVLVIRRIYSKQIT